MEKIRPHKYITRSITKRVNHLTTFKTAPNMFKIDAAEEITTHLGTYYLFHIAPRKDIITVEPLANNINCETTGRSQDTETYLRYMHRYGQTQCERKLDAYLRDKNNMRVQTQQNSYSERTNQRIESKTTSEQSTISDIRKQRIIGQDSLQEEILQITPEMSAYQHQT